MPAAGKASGSARRQVRLSLPRRKDATRHFRNGHTRSQRRFPWDIGDSDIGDRHYRAVRSPWLKEVVKNTEIDCMSPVV